MNAAEAAVNVYVCVCVGGGGGGAISMIFRSISCTHFFCHEIQTSIRPMPLTIVVYKQLALTFLGELLVFKSVA